MFERELAATAAAMVAPGRGILAIDESGGTIKKRFDLIEIGRASCRERVSLVV